MPKDSMKTYIERLKEKLSVEADTAMPLALTGNFDAAEQMIRAIDHDIYGWLAMARMYIKAIASLGGKDAATNDRRLIKAMFERAVALREKSYPMPHTEYEADSYEEGRSRDRRQVVEELGFDPSQWPNSPA